MIDSIKNRWKSIAAAGVAMAAVFGIGLPENFVDASTEMVAQVAAGGLGLYALGRTVWDSVQKHLNG